MTTRLTPEYEAEITARANAATPGPWGARRGVETDGDIVTLTTGRTDAENYANARFIAHARDDVTALLAELAAVRAELAATQQDGVHQ